ncbi:MAG: zinc ribbon domain-containing protein [Verrucomicrobiota bacterium]|nr:zinc ribbon domain-containing protein [Verrucomicrobiota bacterium]
MLRPFHAVGALYPMPTYEYACEKCGKNFDLFQSMRDAPVTECPKEQCQEAEWGHGKVKRLLGTGAGLIFKGSGFYITDYRSNNYKEGAKKEAPAAPAAASGAEKSSGGKEAATTAPAPAAPAKPAETKAAKPASDS